MIAVDTNQPADALEAARGAFKAYGSAHPRLPVLAHDLAYFWMTRGRFEQALRVFQAVLPHITQPTERLLTVPVHPFVSRRDGRAIETLLASAGYART